MGEDYDYDYEDYDDYDYDDYDYEESYLAEIDKKVEEVIARFGEEAWFMPYAKDLLKKEIITDLQNPVRRVSRNEFRTMLADAVWVEVGSDYGIDYDSWENLYSYENISKLEAITHIVQAFFPGEENPFTFAKENGIISADSDEGVLQSYDLMLVELIKMLSVVMELVDDGAEG